MISRLKEEIRQENGYLFNVTRVIEGTDTEGLPPRGLAISEDEDGVTIHCNAEGKTLDILCGYLRDLLSDQYTISDGSSPLRLTPKHPQPLEEDDDAASEET